MPRYAAVDIGSNSVRMEAADVNGSEPPRILASEREVTRLAGIKSLYSDSFYSREEFAQAYGGSAYRALKDRYDPGGALPDLYDKCVLRH